MSAKTNHTETFSVNGRDLLDRVEKLIREGNVRKITVSDRNGKTLLMMPLTVGVVGALLAPPLAAVATVAALVTECTLTVERS